ncbi:MAG TPA: hypothetical protein VNG33_12045 [Polyangiaceae bacterium]|nr:hypothetical protein [Polyangiaceae bacterium]
MSFPKSFRRLLSRVSLVGVVSLATTSAWARPEAPGMLQAAANMQCVPLCTMCHLTNPGEKSNWSPLKPVAGALVVPITNQVGQADFTKAYNMWAAANPAMAAQVVKGIEPASGADVCGPTYGCAVHVAKEAAAPRDFSGPLWVVGAMVMGGLLRRRKREG